jgi:hypothetical protein
MAETYDESDDYRADDDEDQEPADQDDDDSFEYTDDLPFLGHRTGGTMENPELGRKVLDHIDEHPEQFNMHYWGVMRPACGTMACLAGHTLIQAGYGFLGEDTFVAPDGTHVAPSAAPELRPPDVARQLLGLSYEEYFGAPDEAMLFYEHTNSAAIARFRAIVEASEAAKAAAHA